MSLRTMMMALATMAACTDYGTIDTPIEYRVSGGFGGGTEAELRIERSGRYTRTDGGFPQTQGRLDADSLAELHALIDAADFPSLDDDYSCNCADDLVATVSVEIDDQTHVVNASLSADKPPKLEALLDHLAGVGARARL